MDQSFLEISKRLLAESDVEKLLTVATDIAVDLFGAERGMLILFGADDTIQFETARNFQKEDITQPGFEISRTIIEKVRTEKVALCLRNALAEPSLQKCRSVARLKILSIICTPLKHEETVFGVLYLDNRKVRGVFEPGMCDSLQQLADFISLAAYQALERKQLQQQVVELEAELRGKYQFEAIIGHHPKMVDILKLVAQVADTNATVLIQGESGTGKELIARALHYNSRRKDKPFVAINCAALPENLLESELFGHVRGSFTGAIKDKVGWFESANGGTIFLDEISDMPPHLQVKLLRVLQTGEYSPIGSATIRVCDVRVLTAASRDLGKLMREEKFREELYYRLNVIDITLPPLRERRGDIPLLTQHFIQKYIEKYHKSNLTLSPEARSILMTYHFPGNVRELENIIQRAVVLTEGPQIKPVHLPAVVTRISPPPVSPKQLSPFKVAKQGALAAFERDYLIECLQMYKGNISQAARAAGMDFKNFYAKMKKYDLDANSFKSRRDK